MAKRFTDTTKWDNPWYRKLPHQYRSFWDYILDKCDHAGIWRADLEAASFIIGKGISVDGVVEHFGHRIEFLKDDTWFVPSFIKFQYGELQETSNTHKSVIKLLKSHNIDINNLTLAIPLAMGCPTHMDKDKDKDKIKDKDMDSLTPSDLVSLWNELKNPELPEVIALSPDRRSAASARLKTYPNQEVWEDVMAIINASKFCTGKIPPTGGRKKSWKADFDWLIRPGTIERVLEGKYNQ